MIAKEVSEEVNKKICEIVKEENIIKIMIE